MAWLAQAVARSRSSDSRRCLCSFGKPAFFLAGTRLLTLNGLLPPLSIRGISRRIIELGGLPKMESGVLLTQSDGKQNSRYDCCDGRARGSMAGLAGACHGRALPRAGADFWLYRTRIRAGGLFRSHDSGCDDCGTDDEC